MKKKLIRIIAVLLGLLLVVILLLPEDKYSTHTIHFTNGKDRLQGKLNLPKSSRADSLPLLVFVHGDGALTANAYGYYEPIWNHLAEQGIATLAWDKKGVGGSQGNWLHQSMEERAQEVIDVIAQIRSRKEWKFSKIGLIGFSQAGWVLPLVAARSKALSPDFMIMVSGAVNWIQQSNYLTRQRCKRSSKTTKEIEQALIQNKSDIDFLLQGKSYETYLTYENAKRSASAKNRSLMSRDRYLFVQKNLKSDAKEGLKRLKCPVLAIFGDKDLNVDFRDSRQVYKQLLMKHHPGSFFIKTYTNATHGLLKYEHFQKINPDATYLWKLALWGRKAFIAGFLDDIQAFVRDQKI